MALCAHDRRVNGPRFLGTEFLVGVGVRAQAVLVPGAMAPGTKVQVASFCRGLAASPLRQTGRKTLGCLGCAHSWVKLSGHD